MVRIIRSKAGLDNLLWKTLMVKLAKSPWKIRATHLPDSFNLNSSRSCDAVDPLLGAGLHLAMVPVELYCVAGGGERVWSDQVEGMRQWRNAAPRRHSFGYSISQVNKQERSERRTDTVQECARELFQDMHWNHGI
ncbi:hypothetical protein ONS96_012550 [Cadophora gregata f. sp. sojae]|nr:hypothetical protein ONS96_012550 [Cadophora gregata f. sp. sojae]